MGINYRFGRNPVAFSIVEAMAVLSESDKTRLQKNLEISAHNYGVGIEHPAFSIIADKRDNSYVFTGFVTDLTKFENDTDIRASRLQKAAKCAPEVA